MRSLLFVKVLRCFVTIELLSDAISIANTPEPALPSLAACFSSFLMLVANLTASSFILDRSPPNSLGISPSRLEMLFVPSSLSRIVFPRINI